MITNKNVLSSAVDIHSPLRAGQVWRLREPWFFRCLSSRVSALSYLTKFPSLGGGTPAEKSGSPPALRAYVFCVFSNICVVYFPFMLAFWIYIFFELFDLLLKLENFLFCGGEFCPNGLQLGFLFGHLIFDLGLGVGLGVYVYVYVYYVFI